MGIERRKRGDMKKAKWMGDGNEERHTDKGVENKGKFTNMPSCQGAGSGL
jgi:hypothetical protein